MTSLVSQQPPSFYARLIQFFSPGKIKHRGEYAVNYSVNVIDAQTNVLVAHTRTNKKGNYFLNLTPGTYILIITDQRGMEVYRSKSFTTRRGMINKNFKIR